MAQDDKRVVVVRREREDRISELPTLVIDHILSLLPVEDAARTSILSKKWRHFWAQLPYLGLNNAFSTHAKSQRVLRDVVDTILLKHDGTILKFHLDVSQIPTVLHALIDRWMYYITRNGVKELCLRMPYRSTYKLPSYVLNSSKLTRLELFGSFFKPPHPFVGFQHLTSLRLQEITFAPATAFSAINCPRLVNLALVDCRNALYLNITVPSTLKYLIGHCCPDLNLDLFMNCKGLRKLELEMAIVVGSPYPNHYQRVDLEELLLSVSPTLEFLQMGKRSLMLLAADTIPKGAPFVSLQKLSLEIDFGKLSQITCTLELIKICPNLSTLQILVGRYGDDAEAVLKNLDREITCLDLLFNNLKYVTVGSYECSNTELLFVKLLLACTPSLERMCIELERGIDSRKEMNIIKKLLYSHRASPSLFQFRISRTKMYTAYIMGRN